MLPNFSFTGYGGGTFLDEGMEFRVSSISRINNTVLVRSPKCLVVPLEFVEEATEIIKEDTI